MKIEEPALVQREEAMALILAVLAILVALAAIYLVADGNKRTESKVKQFAEGQIKAQLRTIEQQSGIIDEMSDRLDEFQARIDEISSTAGNTAGELGRLAAEIGKSAPQGASRARPSARAQPNPDDGAEDEANAGTDGDHAA